MDTQIFFYLALGSFIIAILVLLVQSLKSVLIKYRRNKTTNIEEQIEIDTELEKFQKPRHTPEPPKRQNITAQMSYSYVQYKNPARVQLGYNNIAEVQSVSNRTILLERKTQVNNYTSVIWISLAVVIIAVIYILVRRLIKKQNNQ